MWGQRGDPPAGCLGDQGAPAPLAGGDDQRGTDPRTEVGQRGEDHVQDSLEASWQAGLEPGEQSDIHGRGLFIYYVRIRGGNSLFVGISY